ncbi:MAG: hypothetical protein HUU56_03300 [Bdellovibrionaceae bacterium]|nr:hypothetical protein [Pseudobdellovibrionaceae bacterium]
MIKKITAVMLTVASVLLFFQNCSSDFSSLDESSYSEQFVLNQRILQLEQDYDKKYLASLIGSQDIISDSLNIKTNQKNIFLEKATVFVIVKKPGSKATLNLGVDQDQKISLVLNEGQLSLLHEAPANNMSKTTLAYDETKSLVIAARVGKNPQDILLMVNGEYVLPTVQKIGSPIDYNYLETFIETTNTDRFVVFNKTLEPPEMNTFSRYLGRLYGIPTKTSLETPDILTWDGADNALFINVKNILNQKCFRCHSSWRNLNENDYTVASTFTQQKILVVPKRLKDSPLWYYLVGSSDENTQALRNMPKDNPPLSTIELEMIKTWINSL